MLLDKIVCFPSDQPLHMVIALKKLTMVKCVIIVSDESEYAKADIVEELCEESSLEISVETPADLLLKPDRWENTGIILNDCISCNHFALLIDAVRKGAHLYYADVSAGQLMNLFNGEPQLIPGGPVELDVNQIMNLAGHTIEVSTEDSMNSDEITRLLNFIILDKHRWDRVRSKLKNNFSVDGNWIKIGSQRSVLLDRNPSLRDFILFMEKENLISEKHIDNGSVFICVPNQVVRHFIQVTGVWLEALAYRTMKSLPYIDDAMMSVRFLWDESSEYLTNELDVLASLDSRMIAISCKDTINISTETLNELALYAQRLGGEMVIKLLVTSKPITNNYLIERAKAMDIKLIYFNGNIKTFRDYLNRAIKGK